MAVSKKKNQKRQPLIFSKKRWMIFGVILTFGTILRIINAQLAKITPFENQFIHTYFPKDQLNLLFRLPSIIFSIILGYLMVVVSLKYCKRRSIFPFIVLFLFSISPIQIILGSTVNLYIIFLLIASLVILMANRFTRKQLFFTIFSLVIVSTLVEVLLLKQPERSSINGSKIYLLVDYKTNKIQIYNNSFELKKTAQLPGIFLHEKQVNVGPDMPPLSLLIIHGFSQCNFDNGNKGLNIEKVYFDCQKGKYPFKQLNVDYVNGDKQLLSLTVFGKAIFINTNSLDWVVPRYRDTLDIEKRYGLFSIQASSLYFSSPPGYDIWGKVQQKPNSNWWSGVERITFIVGNEYEITYVNGTSPYIYKVYSFANEGLSWGAIQSTINLVTNISLDGQYILYSAISWLIILNIIYQIFKKNQYKKRGKILILCLLVLTFLYLFFVESPTILIVLSAVFLYTNSLSLTIPMSNANNKTFEIAIIILVILTSSLFTLPYISF